jgi:phage tail-like protein
VLASTTPHEILVQSDSGRYLWLRIDMAGNGQNTPIIHQIDIYAPRQSSFQYLPPVFHEDAESAHFLDRYLSYFDVIYDEIATVVESFAAYLDPAGVPSGDFLTWLGSWLDLEFLNAWDDDVRRSVIQQAIALYKARGTIAGLRRLIALYTGIEPIIIEHFRLVDYDGATPGWVDDTLYLAGVRLAARTQDEAKHRFTVVVPRHIVSDDNAQLTLMRMIDAQKPAHTFYDVLSYTPGIRIGCQSMIGVDTLIGDYPAGTLGSLRLGQSSQLDTHDRHLNVGGSRLHN